MRLVHERGNVFAYQSEPDLKLAFEPARDGGRQFRLFLPTQPVATATPLAPQPEDEAQLRALAGRCFNSETSVALEVRMATARASRSPSRAGRATHV